jgi:hypothetical protein
VSDPFEPDSRVMTLIGEFLGDERLETLFVIHPETDRIGARALEAWVERLNARLAVCAVTRDRFSIGGSILGDPRIRASRSYAVRC